MEKNIFNKNVRTDLAPQTRFLAEEEGLGELRNVYHASKPNLSTRIANWIALGLGACLLFLFFVVSAMLASQFYTALPLALAGLLLFVVGGYNVWPRNYACWQVSLWDAGFLYEKGPQRRLFRWSQIESIQGSAVYIPERGTPVFIYKVRHQDGYKVKLDNTFLNISELIDKVLEAFSRQVAEHELNMIPPRDKTFFPYSRSTAGASVTGEEQSPGKR